MNLDHPFLLIMNAYFSSTKNIQEILNRNVQKNPKFILDLHVSIDRKL